MSTAQIKIETTVAANTDKVWEAWTKSEHITKWNFADDSWHCPSATNDMRVGGKYTARMEAKDNSFGFDFEAVYDEIVDQKKITYTMTDGRKATTLFEDQSGKTKVITTFDAESESSVDMQRDGWQAILNNFRKYAESY